MLENLNFFKSTTTYKKIGIIIFAFGGFCIKNKNTLVSLQKFLRVFFLFANYCKVLRIVDKFKNFVKKIVIKLKTIVFQNLTTID